MTFRKYIKEHMKILITIITIILFHGLTAAQTGKAVLILKDSTRINGVGKISGISSIVAVSFKNDTLKYRTYKSKEIIGIDILENNYYRKFRYKYKDGEKFPEIMEIVSIDSLSLYVRIYEDTSLSNNFSHEPIIGSNSETRETVELDNGYTIQVGQSTNMYSFISVPRFSYYVGFVESDDVQHLYTKGLPFAKSFKKSMKNTLKIVRS